MNIKEQPISTIDDITIFLKRREYDPDIKGYRAPYLYRGLSNDTYRLTTTLSRNCKDKQHILEESILQNFTKYTQGHPIMAIRPFHKVCYDQRSRLGRIQMAPDDHGPAPWPSHQNPGLVLFLLSGAALCHKQRSSCRPGSTQRRGMGNRYRRAEPSPA